MSEKLLEESLGSRIVKLRQDAGLNQKQLAKKAKLPASMLCALEYGRVSPRIKTLRKIAEALNVPLAQLVS